MQAGHKHIQTMTKQSQPRTSKNGKVRAKGQEKGRGKTKQPSQMQQEATRKLAAEGNAVNKFKNSEEFKCLIQNAIKDVVG